MAIGSDDCGNGTLAEKVMNNGLHGFWNRLLPVIDGGVMQLEIYRTGLAFEMCAGFSV